MAASNQKFFEVIKPGSTYEFIGKSRIFVGVSFCLSAIAILTMFANAYLIPGRGRMLNWGVDFRGGTEIQVDFVKAVEPAAIRKALDASGYEGAEVVRYGSAGGEGQKSYMLRLGAVSVISENAAKKAKVALAKVGQADLRSFEWSEGGDKLYLRFHQSVDVALVSAALKSAGIQTTQVQVFGRGEDNAFEATLISLDTEIKAALEKSLGVGSVEKIPQVQSVGAKAGKQLQIDGVKAVVGAILLIVLYVAMRFDFRYGPGTIIALLHDAIITVGAFAVTYREFSLTTLAAVLTIIGFSVNDTIVIFDRIRENAARYRDRKFDRVVNQSVNETLSRTMLTSATLLLVTLAMNVFGSGVVRDFAFAMNVGVIIGTYSSVFVASPILIWLNNRMISASTRRQEGTPGRESRRARRQSQSGEAA